MSDFDRFDKKDKDVDKTEFMDFLATIAKLNAARDSNDAHMAKFFYAKYQSFIQAGFTEDQAFKLLLTIVGGLSAKL